MNNIRFDVPSKRVKAAYRRIGPAHPAYGSLKRFARWVAEHHTYPSVAAQTWLASKSHRVTP